MPQPAPDDLVRYLHKVLITLAVAALGLILFRWLHVFMLAFGAALVAVFLRSIADPIRRVTRVGEGSSLAAAVAGVILIAVAAAWFVGAQIAQQWDQLAQALPAAWAAAQRELGGFAAGQWLLERLDEARSASSSGLGPILGRIGRLTGSGAGAVAEIVVVLIAGVYLAAQPDLYHDNLLRLLPPDTRPQVTEAVDETGRALRRWLLGTGVAMVSMGVIVAVGAALLGLPAPLALGLLSGLAEFVPIVGAAVSAVPGLLLAVTKGPDMVLWTLVFYVAAHQFEGHILIPLIQRRVVSVPPALTLFSVLAFGLLFGPLGVIFATPLAVVVLVLVRRLYLHEPVDVAAGKAELQGRRASRRAR
jgi:predicted PurR-regulated permease PerM